MQIFIIVAGMLVFILLLNLATPRHRGPLPKVVGYVNPITGKVRFLPETMGADYARNVFGMIRAPHLDFPSQYKKD